MTKNLKLFLTIHLVMVLVWWVVGAFVAGTFNVVLWHIVWKLFIVAAFSGISIFVYRQCFGYNSQNFIEKFSKPV